MTFQSRKSKSVSIFHEDESEDQLYDMKGEGVQKTLQSLHSKGKLSKSEEEEHQNSQGTGHKESAHHNFQKHTVTTIKKLLRLPVKEEAGDVHECAGRMWSLFLSSKLKTKRVLTFLFGLASFEDPNFSSLLESYGFKEILGYQQSTVRRAQAYLRGQLVEQVNEVTLRASLKRSRRIGQEEEFVAYFMELLRQM